MLDTRRPGKDREMSCAIYLAVSIGPTILIIFHTRVVPSGLLSCSVLLQCSVIVSSASARKGKGEGKGKGRIDKGEVNEGEERKRRGEGTDRKAKVRKGKQTKDT